MGFHDDRHPAGTLHIGTEADTDAGEADAEGAQ